MKKLLTLLAFFTITSVSYGQIEFGVRVGGTFTAGYTELPSASRLTNGVTLDIPDVTNNGNGMGTGFLAGVYARKTLSSGLFFQADLNYGTFLLKQKAENASLGYSTTLDVPTSTLPFTLPIPLETLGVNASGTIMIPTTESESTLEGLNFNLLVGKNFADGKFRVYAGPNFLFVSKSEQTINYSGATASLNTDAITLNIDAPGLGDNVPPSTLIQNGILTAEQLAGATASIGGGLTQGLEQNFVEPVVYDLTKETPAPDRNVKSLIVSLDVGVGTTIPNIDLGIDLRYTVPVFTGVYTNGDIGGFLGITSLTLSYPILKPKVAESTEE